jgi:polyphosphate glucokinase
MERNILVIDIGGTNIKIWGKGGELVAKVPSGPQCTPDQMAEAVRTRVDLGAFEGVSLGFPGRVVRGQPASEPYNLGGGWVDFDYNAAFARPLRIMNDAAMQALGSYEGRRMLFLGLGTSVGSTLIVDRVIVPMDLGSIPHAFGKTLEHLLARSGLRRLGKRKWRAAVLDALPRLRNAFLADYVVLGGGNARKLRRRLPEHVVLGGNRKAYHGGVRLWDTRFLTTAQVYEESQSTLSVAQAR